jgi:hypothetical protein
MLVVHIREKNVGKVPILLAADTPAYYRHASSRGASVGLRGYPQAARDLRTEYALGSVRRG